MHPLLKEMPKYTWFLFVPPGSSMSFTGALGVRTTSCAQREECREAGCALSLPSFRSPFRFIRVWNFPPVRQALTLEKKLIEQKGAFLLLSHSWEVVTPSEAHPGPTSALMELRCQLFKATSLQPSQQGCFGAKAPV